MTTETIIVRTAGITSVALVGVALVAALSGGSVAAAALGAGLVLGVIAFGAVALQTIAKVLPAATLVVALVTFATQAVVLLLVLVAISRGDAFSSVAERGWLAAGVVVATLAWTITHLVLTLRQRVPVYDLPETRVPGRGTGGER